MYSINSWSECRDSSSLHFYKVFPEDILISTAQFGITVTTLGLIHFVSISKGSMYYIMIEKKNMNRSVNLGICSVLIQDPRDFLFFEQVS